MMYKEEERVYEKKMIAFFVNWLMETYQPIQYMKMK